MSWWLGVCWDVVVVCVVVWLMLDMVVTQGRALAERVGRLETSSTNWKARVVTQDAQQFTVAARMAVPSTSPTPTLGPASRTPAPAVFQPASSFFRSVSLPTSDTHKESSNSPEEIQGPIVIVPEICDEEFASFFSKPIISDLQSPDENDINFEEIINTNNSQLLVQKKNVKVQRRHQSRNPVKALVQRTDLRTEYIEVKSSSVFERKPLNMRQF